MTKRLDLNLIALRVDKQRRKAAHETAMREWFQSTLVGSVTLCNTNKSINDPLTSTYSHRPLRTNLLRKET